MQAFLSARRSIAFLCLAVLLIAALIPASSGLPLGTLVPLWLFFAAIVALSIRRPIENFNPPQAAFLSILPSRAPPTA